MADDIKKGFSMSEAMEQHPGVFNPLYISLVNLHHYIKFLNLEVQFHILHC